jgi:hypothetical protein
MTCSALIARLMNKYRWIVIAGAGILAYTAGEMILGDRELGGYVVRYHQVCLSPAWEEWMLTDAEVEEFDDADPLPAALRDVVSIDGEWLTFIGQMSPAQRDELLSRTSSKHDQQAILEMYEEARVREAPDWVADSVPDLFRPHVERWFQRKWPAEEWFAVKDHRHYLVAWVFYALVVAVCLSSPYWRRTQADHAA